MVNELKLKGGELFTYAVINQFSQSEAGIYKGGVPYLCLWTGWSSNTIRKYLRNLEQAGLIQSERGNINGVPFCYYKSSPIPTLQNLKDTPQELKGNPSEIEVPTLQNLKDTTLQNLSGDNNNGKVKGESKWDGRKPTREEVQDYADSIGYYSFNVDRFFNYYDDNGWVSRKTKNLMDWQKTIRNWKRKDEESGKDTSRRFKPSTRFQSKMKINGL